MAYNGFKQQQQQSNNGFFEQQQNGPNGFGHPPVRQMRQNAPIGQMRQNAPVGQMRQNAPVGQMRENALVALMRQNAPRQGFGQNPPAGQMRQNAPTGQMRQNPPVAPMRQNAPRQGFGQSNPQSQMRQQNSGQNPPSGQMRQQNQYFLGQKISIESRLLKQNTSGQAFSGNQPSGQRPPNPNSHQGFNEKLPENYQLSTLKPPRSHQGATESKPFVHQSPGSLQPSSSHHQTPSSHQESESTPSFHLAQQNFSTTNHQNRGSNSFPRTPRQNINHKSIFDMSKETIEKVFSQVPDNNIESISVAASEETIMFSGRVSAYVPNNEKHKFVVAGQEYASVLDYMKQQMMWELTGQMLRQDIKVGLNGQLEVLGVSQKEREKWILERGLLHLQKAYLEKAKHDEDFADDLIKSGRSILIYNYNKDPFLGVPQSKEEVESYLKNLAEKKVYLHYSKEYPLTVKSLSIQPKFIDGHNVLGSVLMSLRQQLQKRNPISSLQIYIPDHPIYGPYIRREPIHNLKRPARRSIEDEPPIRRLNIGGEAVESPSMDCQFFNSQISMRNKRRSLIESACSPDGNRSGSIKGNQPMDNDGFTPIRDQLEEMGFVFEEGTRYCDMVTPEPTNERGIWDEHQGLSHSKASLNKSTVVPNQIGPHTPPGSPPRSTSPSSSVFSPPKNGKSKSVLESLRRESRTDQVFSPASAFRSLALHSPLVKSDTGVFKVPRLPSTTTSKPSNMSKLPIFHNFSGSVTSRASTESPALSVKYAYSIPDEEEIDEDEQFGKALEDEMLALLKTPRHQPTYSPMRDPDQEIEKLRKDGN